MFEAGETRELIELALQILDGPRSQEIRSSQRNVESRILLLSLIRLAAISTLKAQ